MQRYPAIHLLLLALILLLLFGWLGIQPLSLEEPRRAVVAMEMQYSGDYIAPSIFGEAYFKKPPVWNWILVAAFSLFGDDSEFALRFFSVFSFLTTALLLFWFTKKYHNKEIAWLTTLLYLVSADIFLYFSLTAEIDLFYSLLILGIFLFSYHFYERKSPWALFLSVYSIGALAFLTKGMPTLVFIPLTLLTLFILKKNVRGLFSLPHYAGIFLFFFLIGTYLYAYSRQGDIRTLIEILWDESSQRTAGEMPWHHFFTHLFIFPLDILKNIFPASLLIIVLFRYRGQLVKNETDRILFWVLAVNILLYWLSPGTRQRYVYMLYPLMILLLSSHYHRITLQAPQAQQLLLRIILGLSLLLGAAYLAFPLIPQLAYLPNRLLAAVLGIGMLGGAAYLFLLRSKNILLFLVIMMLSIRLAGNLTLVTYRGTSAYPDKAEAEEGCRLGEMTEGHDLYVLGQSEIPLRVAYYAYRQRASAFKMDRQLHPEILYLSDPLQLSRQEQAEIIDTFFLADSAMLFLIYQPAP